MSAVDEAWFRMDSPRNPMVVPALMELEDVADVPAFATELVRRLLRHDRFRQRVVDSGGRRTWLDDGEPNLAYHLRVHARVQRQDELHRLVTHEAEQPLDLAMPLWRIALFPCPGRRLTVLFRAHHAVADGIALMRLLLGLVRDEAPAPHAAPRHGPLAGLIDKLDSLNSVFEDVGHELAEELRHPERLPQQLTDARRAIGAIARVLSLPDDNPPRLTAPLSGRRTAAWICDLALGPLKRAAAAHGCTINDILLAALAGAFGTVLRGSRAEVPGGQNLRVTVPVNLREGDDSDAGNQFGLVLVDLPLGVEDRAARIRVVAARMRTLKDSMEARATLATLGAVGYLPLSLEQRLIDLVAGKAVAVVSNLRGPREELSFAGARVRNIAFWPPRTAGVGIGIGMLSYADRVSIGISADAAQLARPQDLLDELRRELDPETLLPHA